VVEHPGFFLSQDDNPSCAVGEPLEHLVAPHRAVRQVRDIRALSSRMVAPTRRPLYAEDVPREQGVHPPSNYLRGVGCSRYAASERRLSTTQTHHAVMAATGPHRDRHNRMIHLI
jgi:hypothetical protein